jgi:hypothetical protein
VFEKIEAVWETEKSDFADCQVRVEVDGIDESVGIDVIGISHIGVALSFAEWDAIVAAVAEARKAGVR